MKLRVWKFEKIKVPMLRFWISLFAGLRVTKSIGRVCFGHWPFYSDEMKGRGCKFEKLEIPILRHWISLLGGFRARRIDGKGLFLTLTTPRGWSVGILNKYKYPYYGDNFRYSGVFWVVGLIGRICFWYWPLFGVEIELWGWIFEKVEIPMLRYWNSLFVSELKYRDFE